MAIPSSQRVVVAAHNGTSVPIFRYDPRAEAWETAYDFDGAGFELRDPVMLVWDAVASRLLLFVGYGVAADAHLLSFFSDDEGDSWQLYGQGYLPEDTGTGPGTIAAQPREP